MSITFTRHDTHSTHVRKKISCCCAVWLFTIFLIFVAGKQSLINVQNEVDCVRCVPCNCQWASFPARIHQIFPKPTLDAYKQFSDKSSHRQELEPSHFIHLC